MNNILSDDQPIKVRRLYFLELEDEVPYLDPGMYIHVYMVDGHSQSVGYNLQDFGEIPEKPKTPFAEIQPNSLEEALWGQYHLYRAVLTHEHKRGELREQYLVNCARYILTNCIASKERKRIITPDDYDVVYRQALCPEVTEEDIVAVLATVFQGNMEGQAFMDFSQEVEGVGRILYSDETLGAAINVSSWVDAETIQLVTS